MVDLTEELRKPPRVNRTTMAIGTALCAFVAVIVGLIFGAWAVLQPYPEPTVGPVSLYIVAAGGLCLAAGRQIGMRSSVMKRGYSDPGWITPGILVVLAAGCIGIWTSSLTATGHTPEASVKNSVAAATAPQSSLTPAQKQVVSGSCASGNYPQCVSIDLSQANARIGDYSLARLLCQGYKDIPNPDAQRLYGQCSAAIWSQTGSKSIVQRNVTLDCLRADADAAQVVGADPNDPNLHCSPTVRRFLASPSTSPNN